MQGFRMFVVAAGIAVVVAACQQDPRLTKTLAGRHMIADQLDAHGAAIARHEVRLTDIERRLAACEGK